MKKSGVLNSLKSQLRTRLYEQLKLNNERPDSNLNLKDINNRLSFKIAVSLIADLMKKCVAAPDGRPTSTVWMGNGAGLPCTSWGVAPRGGG